MPITTAIFDMDGLLIDSEPLWYEAALESLAKFKIHINHQEYYSSTGLRTKEFLEYWLGKYKIDLSYIVDTELDITNRVIKKVFEKGEMMPGVETAIQLALQHQLKIGLASSSPLSLINAVLEKTQLTDKFTATCSAEHLPYGKPHPQVFIDCAIALESKPVECICFEDSFNGLLAAKAARMKCIVVPLPEQLHAEKWNIAELKLSSLEELKIENFSALL
ncbi:MAG: hexitol phosphatase HxpB [Bacteroidota bacterium]|jgi:sugar-phosphatase